LRRLGKYAAAEPVYRRALAAAEQTMGTAAPDLAVCLDNHAFVLERLGRKAEAARAASRAAAIRGTAET